MFDTSAGHLVSHGSGGSLNVAQVRDGDFVPQLPHRHPLLFKVSSCRLSKVGNTFSVCVLLFLRQTVADLHKKLERRPQRDELVHGGILKGGVMLYSCIVLS